ncbi:hypothetical protein Bca52824_089929 [Brassica carinata]|uniref:Uncharacterized protein n=1 Tax=Brassica carinata TaxID=52824 RepID=A0A8X7TEU4_BRACI|nr:hypothetical protein Bca52824_089929 [Brassica carinata]
MQSGGGPSWTLDGEFDFEDDMENPRVHSRDRLYSSSAGQQQGKQQMVSRIYQTATHLPKVCNIPQVSVCPFQKTMPGPSY